MKFHNILLLIIVTTVFISCASHDRTEKKTERKNQPETAWLRSNR